MALVLLVVVLLRFLSLLRFARLLKGSLAGVRAQDRNVGVDFTARGTRDRLLKTLLIDRCELVELHVGDFNGMGEIPRADGLWDPLENDD